MYPYNITNCVHTNLSESYFDSLIMHGTEIYGKWGCFLSCTLADKCHKWMVSLHCLHECHQCVSVKTRYAKMISCRYCSRVAVTCPLHPSLECYLHLETQSNSLFVPKYDLLHLVVQGKLLVLKCLVLVVG